MVALVALVAGQQRPASAPATASSQPTSTSPAGPRIVDFGDGIKINYVERQVEVQGEVILREGPLELFAYCKAPAPKEHESIVLVKARPQRIFMALGLIGATPGVTMRWNPETQTLREPTGDPIDVQIRYFDGKRDRRVAATEWMLDASKRKPMPRTHWIFCGSERSDSGEFAANMEGTLVTVVDFTTSVLGLPQRHSDADAELWLMANPEVIPPVGTAVSLILRPLPTEIELRVDASGAYFVDGQRMPIGDLRSSLTHRTAGWIERATVMIETSEAKPAAAEVVDRLKRELSEIGFEESRIRFKAIAGESASGKASPVKTATSQVGR